MVLWICWDVFDRESSTPGKHMCSLRHLLRVKEVTLVAKLATFGCMLLRALRAMVELTVLPRGTSALLMELAQRLVLASRCCNRHMNIHDPDLFTGVNRTLPTDMACPLTLACLCRRSGLGAGHDRW
jgi:hypothetical protein